MLFAKHKRNRESMCFAKSFGHRSKMIHRIIFIAAFDSPHQVINQKEKAPYRCFFLFGGVEGSRTPVRKSIHASFSGCSLSIRFPNYDADKQASQFVSFLYMTAINENLQFTFTAHLTPWTRSRYSSARCAALRQRVLLFR